VNRQASGPKIHIVLAQQTDLGGPQAMAIGHTEKRAIPFVCDGSKQALCFVLRQDLDEAILSWSLQSCLGFHDATEYLFYWILATTSIENTGPRARAVS
jgi:hypothetical protein